MLKYIQRTSNVSCTLSWSALSLRRCSTALNTSHDSNVNTTDVINNNDIKGISNSNKSLTKEKKKNSSKGGKRKNTGSSYGRDKRHMEEFKKIHGRPAKLPSLRGEFVFGTAPVFNALLADRRRMFGIYVMNNNDDDKPKKNLEKEATFAEKQRAQLQALLDGPAIGQHSENNNVRLPDIGEIDDKVAALKSKPGGDFFDVPHITSRQNEDGDADILKMSKEGIIKLAEERGLPIHYLSKRMMFILSGDRPHQGVGLDAFPAPHINLDWLPKRGEPDWYEKKITNNTKPYPLWVALDSVSDPMNLGAIIRTCCFLGVDGIIRSRDSSARMSSWVSKASAGAAESMPVHSTRDLGRFLRESKGRGWGVIGAEAAFNSCYGDPNDTTDDRETKEKSIIPLTKLLLRRPTVLVFGNEGSGLTRDVSEAVNLRVFIPPSPSLVESGAAVDSLNVSASVACIVSHLSLNLFRVPPFGNHKNIEME